MMHARLHSEGWLLPSQMLCTSKCACMCFHAVCQPSLLSGSCSCMSAVTWLLLEIDKPSCSVRLLALLLAALEMAPKVEAATCTCGR